MAKAEENHWVRDYFRNERVARLAMAEGFKLLAGYEYRHGPDQDPIVVTWHKNFDLNYVLAGEGEYIDRENRKYRLYPGVFFWRLPEIHTTRIDSREYAEAYLSISREALDLLQAFHPSVSKIPRVVEFGLLHEIALRYEKLIREIREAPEPQLAPVALRILEFYLEILGGTSSRASRLIENACLLITADLSSRDRLEQVARRLGLGYSNFRRLFHEVMGLSPGDYRIKKRIESACELMSAGSSQKEAAFALGYPDVQGFSMQFRRFMGLSPGTFLERIHHKRMDQQTGTAFRGGRAVTDGQTKLSR